MSLPVRTAGPKSRGELMPSKWWSIIVASFLVFSFAAVSAQARTSQRVAGIAIDKDDTVYVWWKDGVVTTGTSFDFEAKSHARPYTLPAGETGNDIVAMSISGSDNHVHVWYRDNKTSAGTATDLSVYVSL